MGNIAAQEEAILDKLCFSSCGQLATEHRLQPETNITDALLLRTVKPALGDISGERNSFDRLPLRSFRSLLLRLIAPHCSFVC